jgi:poly-gamma-glutamate synthesis protein (capsule biosynthesis protein)
MNSLKINFCGDIALFKYFQENRIDPFKEIFLPEADFNIGNLEFPISDKNRKYFDNVEDKYHIEQWYAKQIKLEKFDAFSLANNHILDYGVEGISTITKILESKNILYFGCGPLKINPLKIEIKNIKICIIGFCKIGNYSKIYNGFGPDDYNLNDLIEYIKSIKNIYDYIVLYPHWGTELVDIPRSADIKNAHALIDAGADAIIGHHPHILQGREIYNGKNIIYSLGSFIYLPEQETGYFKWPKTRNNALVVQLEFDNQDVKFNFFFYKYSYRLKIPLKNDNINILNYYNKISLQINNKKLYKRKKYSYLLFREIKAFLERLINNPFLTLKYYFIIIKDKMLN